jgi:murein DD-endopeptidase MepM/ murein hydrolase activator NlpD
MKKKSARFYLFLRRNAVYVVLAFCILAVSLSVAYMLINGESDKKLTVNNDVPVVEQPEDELPEKPEEPVVKQVSFIIPVNEVSSINDYSELMVWNSTLGHYTAHLAIDFIANEGADVYAVYDGKVSSIETSLLTGTTITIDHGDGLFTIYNSLEDGEHVTIGQEVKQGDVIGQVSATNRQEQAHGAHLHFQAVEDGQIIDPAKYMDFGEK